MDLGILEQSSKMTPLLVRLYDSSRLDGLAKADEPLARHELISAVTELLEMDLSPRESELVADVLIGLMRQAALDMRQALSEKLALLDNVPLRLVLQMANDEIEVADTILAQSTVLDDLDLIYILKSKGPEYWQAMARRDAMSNQLMNLLADTRDLDTAFNLVTNKAITLTEHTLGVLSDMAQNSDKLAQPLLRREEITAEIARALYQFVGEDLKAFINEEYGISTGSIIQAVDEVMVEMDDASKATGEYLPTESMNKAAARYRDKGLLTTKLMLGSLRRGQVAAFISQFAAYTGLKSETVLEILAQQNGQGLAITCKAFEINKEDFVSIFLLSNRVRNHGRMVDLTDMTKAINYYARVESDVALGIIQNSLEDALKS